MSRIDARRLDTWAELHGEIIEPEAPEAFACPRHGPYTPHSLLDADCPRCDLEDHQARQDARYDWLTSQTHN